MNGFEVFNQTEEMLKETDTMKRVLAFALSKEKIENVEFSVILVTNKEIRKINKEYRNIDKETDVISFALEDEKDMFLPIQTRVLGDIYISICKAKEQAREYGHTLERELCFLAIHGLLHLLGYDHIKENDEKEMFQKQKEILEEYGIKR